METNLAQVEPFLDMFAFVKEQINVSAIILFGSRARGIAKEHNDYDFIIVGDFSEPYLERSDWFLEKAPALLMDLFCYTPQEFEMLFSTYTLTAIDAIGEGIVIYGEEWVQPYQARYQRLIELGMSKV